MKKIIVVLIVMTVLTLNSTFAFSDLDETHWAYNNVMTMYEKGLVSGFNDGTFKPDDTLTREQFITMLVNALQLKREGNSSFIDIENRWSTDYIKSLGYCLVDDGDTLFRPGEVALREDIAMGIVKAKGLENSTYNISLVENFSDLANISKNRNKYVAIAVENGFMSGNANGTFSPQKALTRAEGASVISNLLNSTNNTNFSEVITEVKNIPIGAYIAYETKTEDIVVLGTDTGTDDDQIFNPIDYISGWRVLYNNDGQVEIISAESVGNLTLGKGASATNEFDSCFDGSKNGYANAIYVLNKMCNDYANPRWAVSGRCPGQGNGIDILFSEGITLADISHANLGKKIEARESLFPYEDDHNEMELENIRNNVPHQNGIIWLASRGIGIGGGTSVFLVNTLRADGKTAIAPLYMGSYSSESDANSMTFGVRPIISLKRDIEIIGGDGTKSNPYKISIVNSNDVAEKVHIHKEKSRYIREDENRHAVEIFCEVCKERMSRIIEEHVFKNGKCKYCESIEKKGNISNVAKVGEYVKYIPDNNNYVIKGIPDITKDQIYNPSKATSWRIFSNDGETVKLISSESIGNLSLWEGTGGYRDSVNILNELCQSYVNTKYATSGRSLGSADLWTYDIAKSDQSLGTLNNYPLAYGVEGFPYSDDFYINDLEILINNELTISDRIWLASRFSDTEDSITNFGVRYIEGNLSDNIKMYMKTSKGGGAGSSQMVSGVRPVITLKAEVQIISGEGSYTSPYEISIN